MIHVQELLGFLRSLALPEMNPCHLPKYDYSLVSDLSHLLRIERLVYNVRRHIPMEFLDLYKKWYLEAFCDAD